MSKFLYLISQRRVWAGIVGFLSFTLTFLKIKYEIDIPTLTDLLTAFGGSLAALISACLALWSFLKPKDNV